MLQRQQAKDGTLAWYPGANYRKVSDIYVVKKEASVISFLLLSKANRETQVANDALAPAARHLSVYSLL